jgi:predicted adenine nucleotide alpha hydrolase (AANH) superfamily ATPase
MRVLLHVCCAACAIGPFEDLVAEGHDVRAYFCNPNIHPFVEFRRRLKAFKVLQERLPIRAVCEEQYGLLRFLSDVRWDTAERCRDCYHLRLGLTASRAAEDGAEAITSSLLGSTHQDHELIRSVLRSCSLRHGLVPLERDWRPRSEEGQRRARAMNLYAQAYCGCVFSEWERYRHTRLHVYRGPGPRAKD